MANLREYFEKDFAHTIKLHIKVPIKNEFIEGAVLYDFAGFFAFVVLYVASSNRDYAFFADLLAALEYGKTQFVFTHQVTLSLAKEFPGQLEFQEEGIEIRAQYFGDTEWISSMNIQASRRVFIYSETDLSSSEIASLKVKARELGHELQFRAERFREERSKHEKPLAFISHDSRDKEAVAKKIAIRLQQMLCPIWYDEFSLKLGENLRESIEKGLRECRKCILVLSPNFFANKGWTKIEFDSIFTRQILEEQKLVLPIWYGITKHDVYNYSPSLLNVKGVDWSSLGEEEVCRQIYNAIMN